MSVRQAEHAPVGGSRGLGGVRAAVAGSMAAKLAELVSLVLLATVVPRALGPAAYGRFAVPLTIVTLGSLALTLGGQTVMARYVPDAPPTERVALAGAIGRRLARGRLLTLGVLSVPTAVVALVHPDLAPPATTAAVFVALSLNVVATLALQVPLGLGRSGPWTARWPLQNAVLIVTVLILFPAIGDAGGVVAVVVASFAAAVFGVHSLGPVRSAGHPPVRLPDGSMRFGALHAGGAGLTQFAQRGGVLSVALLGGTTVETGQVALALGLALGVAYAVLQAFTVSLPHVVGRPDGETVLRRLAGGLVAVLVPTALVSALVFEPVARAVVGPAYASAGDTFLPAIALVVLAPLHALAVQVAALRDRPGAALAAGAASAAAFVLVSVAAVPVWGGLGGTCAALAAGTAGAAVAMRRLPGAVGGRLAAASIGGVGLVVAAGTLA